MTARIMLAAGAIAMLGSAFTINAPAEARSRAAYCRDVATQEAWRDRHRGNPAAGAIGGAVAGGVIGGLVGHGKAKNIGAGALIGGVTGTAIGAANRRGSYVDEGAYNDAYWNCMNDGRRMGYSGYGDYRGRYRASQSEVDYCMARFRSYNPSTGMYLAYSGQYRPCP
ncbi:MAG TPA: BA14K family protein [Aestuariivirga sp.]|nr:BA14K family protein [Aestuariivirga sp.]